MKKDLYESLGVDKGASAAEIKDAYKAQSKKHHPDKGGDNDKFQEISHAYSILKDDKKRARYDSTGQEKETPFEVRFTEFIQHTLIKYVDEVDVDTTDLLDKLKNFAKGKIMEGEGMIGKMKAQLKKLEKVNKRMTAKGVNSISKVIEMNIYEIKRQVAEVEDNIKFLGEVLECLGSYHYQFEAPPPQSRQYVYWGGPDNIHPTMDGYNSLWQQVMDEMNKR